MTDEADEVLEDEADDAAKLQQLLDGWETRHEGGSTLRLEEPIKFGQQEFTEISVGRVRAREMRLLKSAEPSVGDMLTMAESLCGMTARQIDKLCVPDTMRLCAVIGRDFGGGLGGAGGR
ncbi:MAG: phage tail assembly protein [Planctomycetota bacterium]